MTANLGHSGLFDDDDNVDPADPNDDQTPQVTALIPLPDDQSRLRIRVGKRTIGTLKCSDVEQLGIAVGMAWTDQVKQQFHRLQTLDKANKAALGYLQRRARSCGEVAQHLSKKGFDDQISAEVIQRLTSLGYLDDTAYAHALIQELVARRPAGPHLLRRKLRSKLLDRQLVDQLVAEAHAEIDQSEAIERFISRKLTSMAGLDDRTRARRLFGVLARRGFPPDQAQQLVRRHVQTADQEQEQ